MWLSEWWQCDSSDNGLPIQATRTARARQGFPTFFEGAALEWTFWHRFFKRCQVSQVTRLLESMQSGESQAAAELLPLVYDELRGIAAHKMLQEQPGHTLQPTALVHEAWMRMMGDGNEHFANRAHFFAVAAEAMRRILVESARSKLRLKRGSGAKREELDDAHLIQSAPSEEVLAIHEALDLLAAEDAQCADLVKLRYFVGMTMDEAASALNLSQRSAGPGYVGRSVKGEFKAALPVYQYHPKAAQARCAIPFGCCEQPAHCRLERSLSNQTSSPVRSMSVIPGGSQHPIV